MKLKLIKLTQIIFILFLSSCIKDENPQEETPPIDYIANELTLPETVEMGSFDLPTSFQGMTITWTSSHEEIITTEGIVSRILVNQDVTLTAHYVFEGVSKTKFFVITVIGNPYTALELVQMDHDELGIPLEISGDLTLPTWGVHGSAIIWSSSHDYILSKSGKYYAPLEDEIVTLTAAIRFESSELVKVFEITVKAMPDLEKVQKDHAMLELRIPIPLSSFTLPSRGYFTSEITWQSSHPEIISHEGYYTKPIGNITVTLTATIQKGDASMEKTFDINVEGYSPEHIEQEIEKALKINHGIDVIFSDVILPTRILNLVDVSWSSSHPEIISETGEYRLPDITTSVTLTAEMTVSEKHISMPFNFTVYGLNDQSTELIDQKINTINFNLNDLFVLDENDRLTMGSFDQIVYRNNRLMIAGNMLTGSYTSPIYHSPEALKRINFMWGSISSEHATSSFYLRYLTPSGWTEFLLQGNWGYGGENQPPQITLNFPENVFDIQYQIILKRDNLETPSPEITFVSLQPIADQKNIYDIQSLRQTVFYEVPQLKQADTTDPFLWPNICWATSISMMLQYYQKLTDLKIPQEYYSVLIRQGTERFGTTKNDIGSTQFNMVLHELEFHSYEMLLHVLDHYGHVIIGVSKGSSPTGAFGPISFSSGHVVVVVGYEIHEDGKIDIIINDPAVSWMRFPIKGSVEELMMVWDKGGMLMQPKTTI
ncbi:MAG: hypothetical protein A2Z84_07060 [Tenericutes bacterium GWA2_35_7]|nr:MAG: hypothetical protein A2Z84_07060 [Tenericutes bacterium GWA2_35_7]